MAEACELERPFDGTIKVDESYFGPRRVKGKVGRRAGRKLPDFGIFKRDGKVYAEVVPNCSKAVFTAGIRGKVFLVSVIHLGAWRGTPDLWRWATRSACELITPRASSAARPSAATTSTGMIREKGFGSYAKTRPARFRGMHSHAFLFHLKECEFRFNHRRQNLYKALLKLCRENPLSKS